MSATQITKEIIRTINEYMTIKKTIPKTDITTGNFIKLKSEIEHHQFKTYSSNDLWYYVINDFDNNGFRCFVLVPVDNCFLSGSEDYEHYGDDPQTVHGIVFRMTKSFTMESQHICDLMTKIKDTKGDVWTADEELKAILKNAFKLLNQYELPASRNEKKVENTDEYQQHMKTINSILCYLDLRCVEINKEYFEYNDHELLASLKKIMFEDKPKEGILIEVLDSAASTDSLKNQGFQIGSFAGSYSILQDIDFETSQPQITVIINCEFDIPKDVYICIELDGVWTDKLLVGYGAREELAKTFTAEHINSLKINSKVTKIFIGIE